VFIADLLKVFLANRLRKRLTFKTINIINKISGLTLLVFGIVIMAGILFYKSR